MDSISVSDCHGSDRTRNVYNWDNVRHLNDQVTGTLCGIGLDENMLAQHATQTPLHANTTRNTNTTGNASTRHSTSTKHISSTTCNASTTCNDVATPLQLNLNFATATAKTKKPLSLVKQYKYTPLNYYTVYA